MSEQIFLFGVLLWFALAYSVGSHARGHHRSSILWFSITATTGLFGVAFYLLTITSEEKPEPGRGSQIDNRIKKYTLIVVIGTVIGLLTGFLIVFGAYSTLPGIRRPEPYYWVILYLGLIGAGIGPITYYNKKHGLIGYSTGE